MRNLYLAIIIIISFPMVTWGMGKAEKDKLSNELLTVISLYGDVGISRDKLQVRLGEIRSKIKQDLQKDSDNSQLWLLLAQSSYAYLYSYDYSHEERFAQTEKMKNIRAKQAMHRKDMTYEYQKVFELEMKESIESSLFTCSMYEEARGMASISYEGLLFMRKHLEKCNMESAAEIDIHTSIAVGMAKLGKLDEALAELDEMRQVYKSMGQNPNKVADYVYYVKSLAKEASAKQKGLDAKVK